MRILAITAVAAAGAALSGCPIAGGAKYTVGGTVTGLSAAGLVLELNGGDDLSFSASGSFVFGKRLDNKAAYSVTIKTQPANSALTCAVRNGSGAIDKMSISNVILACTQPGRFVYVANRASNSISGFGIEGGGALVPLSGSPYAAAGTTPTALIVDPNGEFLYVADSGSNTVAAFAIDPTTGALTATGAAVAAGSGPDALTVDPTDHYLYVANLASNNVSAFLIGNGTLTPVAGSPFNAGAGPASLAIDPNGNFLYATNFSGNSVMVFLIDQASGMLSAVSGSPFGSSAGPLSIAIDPTESFAFVAGNGAEDIASYSLNPTTGSLTAASGAPLAAGAAVEALTADPTGRYVIAANAAAANQVASFSIAPTSGALTLLSAVNAGSLPVAVAIDGSGLLVYAVNFNSNDVSAYTLNAGVLAPVAGSPFAAGGQPHAIAID